LLGLLAMSAAPGPAAAAWQMYGNDPAHTGRSSANGPSTPSLIWTYPGVSVGETASPVVGPDGTIYVPGTVAINPDGTVKWQRSIGRTLLGPPWVSPAVAADGTVYVVDETFDPGSGPTTTLYALDPANGDTRWSHPIERTTYGSPTVGPDGTIYIGSAPSFGQGSLYAINPDGTQKWRWDSGSSCWIESSPAIGASGDVYVNHNCLGLVALDGNGNRKWNRGEVGEAWNSPSVGPDGTVYIGSSPGFNAVSPDGTLKWSAPTSGWTYEASSAISADGSTIYRGDNDGNFYAFAASGCVRWRYDTRIRGPIFSAPALAANGIVYFTQGSSTETAPSDRGYLFALRATDGALSWRYEIGFSSSSPAIASDGSLYAIGHTEDGDGVLYAFQGGGGSAGGTLTPCSSTAPDRTPPVLTLGGKRSQGVIRQKGVVVVVGCPSEACTATAKGTVSLPSLAKVYRLRTARTQIAKGGKARVKLSASRKVLKAMGRALRRRNELAAKITVTARDAVGNATTRGSRIRLRR
jgi:outer membrane protein assembly factor BamB